jgi:hypothetical protein
LLSDSWLVGTSSGVYVANDQGTFERMGAYQFRVTALDRSSGRILAATGSGMWEVRQDRWVQRHDETLTEVMDVIDDGERMIAASAYGVAFGTTDPSGVPHWDWLSNNLHVNQRFTNAVLRMDDARLLAGTEGGVLIHHATSGWRTTSLVAPVRCLLRHGDEYLAGADDGLWSSDDGQNWRPAGVQVTVYALTTVQNLVVAGTEQGVLVSSDGRPWCCAGLAGMRVTAVAISPVDAGHWYAGGMPGGLWITRDQGQSWVAVPEIRVEVEAISAPGDRS